ncbi:MAG TPA: glycosyltransferase [Opitutus sp.]|nr:glycosyltransferase [Opitutus sp.]
MARILVIHPALGTGGGSRWSLQAAEALAARGHAVTWVTSAPRQPAPAWREFGLDTFHREFVGQFWPESVGDRGRAFLSNRRMTRLIRWCQGNVRTPDAVLADGVPFAMSAARRAFPRSRVVFFCHFPELLYARRTPWLLAWHRRYWIRRERAGLGATDHVLANSDYTRRRLLEHFPEFEGKTSVCHPAVAAVAAGAETPRHILCVARWAPEKNLPLAVRAFAEYRARAAAPGATPLPLVLAGGFDPGSPAAQATWVAVEDEVRRAGLDDENCRLLRNPSDAELDELYRRALSVVHPAPHEHFGMIAPEAMLRGIPVIGIAGSGLAESVVEGETGFLVAPEPAPIAERLVQLQRDEPLRSRLGATARERAAGHFLITHLGARLEAALQARAT